MADTPTELELTRGALQREIGRAIAVDAELTRQRQRAEKAEAERDALKAELDRLNRESDANWEAARAELAEARAAISRVRRAVVDVYGEDCGGDDVAAGVERLLQHEVEHDANVRRILQRKNEALERAQAAIERGRAIHAPEQYHDELQPWCTYCNRDDNQRDDVVLWPCPTLAALAVPESGVVIERDAFGPSAVRVVDMLKTPDAPTGGED